MCEQVWRNQDDLNLYLRSEDYRRMLLLMELAGEPPEIKFQTISSPAGIEVIEKARGIHEKWRRVISFEVSIQS